MKKTYRKIWDAWPETLVDGIITFRKLKDQNAYDVCLAEDTVIGAIHVEIFGFLSFKYSFEPASKYSKFSRVPETQQRAITKRFGKQLANYVFVGE